MQLFQRLGDMPVQQPPPGCAQPAVCHLTQFVMAEVVGVCTLFANNPPQPQLIELVDQGVLLTAAYFRQQLKTELSTDRRRKPGKLTGWRRELRQSRFEH